MTVLMGGVVMDKVFSFKCIDNPEFCEDYMRLKLRGLEESGALDPLHVVSFNLNFDKQMNGSQSKDFIVAGTLAKADGSIIECKGSSHKVLDSIDNMVDNLKSQISHVNEDTALEFSQDSFYPYYYTEYS